MIDDMYNTVFRELITYMMEDPRNITPCTHLLFIAKNLERIGDHATNIAEIVHYAVKGEPLTEARPKGDTSAYAVVRPRRMMRGRTRVNDALASNADVRDAGPPAKQGTRHARCSLQPVETAGAGGGGRGRAGDHAALQPGKAGLPRRGGGRRPGGADPHRRDAARPGAAGLDAAGDVGHRGVPPDPPARRTRATCR